MGPYYMVVYQPHGYKPTYLVIHGPTLALVRNPHNLRKPLRFRLESKCEQWIEKYNAT